MELYHYELNNSSYIRYILQSLYLFDPFIIFNIVVCMRQGQLGTQKVIWILIKPIACGNECDEPYSLCAYKDRCNSLLCQLGSSCNTRTMVFRLYEYICNINTSIPFYLCSKFIPGLCIQCDRKSSVLQMLGNVAAMTQISF